MSNPSIKRLDPTVVNRIAAGEVSDPIFSLFTVFFFF
jgi:DNA mismatch repair ATPase MutL